MCKINSALQTKIINDPWIDWDVGWEQGAFEIIHEKTDQCPHAHHVSSFLKKDIAVCLTRGGNKNAWPFEYSSSKSSDRST